MNGELAHRADFTNFFQVAKARSGAGRPVDVRLAPTEVERRPLTTDNEDREAIRVRGAEQLPFLSGCRHHQQQIFESVRLSVPPTRTPFGSLRIIYPLPKEVRSDARLMSWPFAASCLAITLPYSGSRRTVFSLIHCQRGASSAIWGFSP